MIRAVLLSGPEVTSLSSNVHIFQAPRMSCLSFVVFFVVSFNHLFDDLPAAVS